MRAETMTTTRSRPREAGPQEPRSKAPRPWSGLLSKGRSVERRQTKLGLLFISPWIIGFLAFTLYPFLATFYYSFMSYTGVGAMKFICLDNYTKLFHDPLFWTSLSNTLYYTVFEVPLSMIVALAWPCSSI